MHRTMYPWDCLVVATLGAALCPNCFYTAALTLVHGCLSPFVAGTIRASCKRSETNNFYMSAAEKCRLNLDSR